MRHTRTPKTRSPSSNGNFIDAAKWEIKYLRCETLVKKHIARNEIRGDEWWYYYRILSQRYQNITEPDRFSSATHARKFVSADAECLLYGNTAAGRIFTVVLSWVREIELIDFLQHRLQLAGVKKDVKMRMPGVLRASCVMSTRIHFSSISFAKRFRFFLSLYICTYHIAAEGAESEIKSFASARSSHLSTSLSLIHFVSAQWVFTLVNTDDGSASVYFCSEMTFSCQTTPICQVVGTTKLAQDKRIVLQRGFFEEKNEQAMRICIFLIYMGSANAREIKIICFPQLLEFIWHNLLPGHNWNLIRIEKGLIPCYCGRFVISICAPWYSNFSFRALHWQFYELGWRFSLAGKKSHYRGSHTSFLYHKPGIGVLLTGRRQSFCCFPLRRTHFKPLRTSKCMNSLDFPPETNGRCVFFYSFLGPRAPVCPLR